MRWKKFYLSMVSPAQEFPAYPFYSLSCGFGKYLANLHNHGSLIFFTVFPSVYLFIYPSIHSCIHASIHPPTQPAIHPASQPASYPLLHPPIRSSIHPPYRIFFSGGPVTDTFNLEMKRTFRFIHVCKHVLAFPHVPSRLHFYPPLPDLRSDLEKPNPVAYIREATLSSVFRVDSAKSRYWHQSSG